MAAQQEHKRTNPAQGQGLTLYDDFYRQYAKPLEEEHRGEYLAVSLEGKTVLGEEMVEVARKAAETLGPEVFLFKIGEAAVGKWR